MSRGDQAAALALIVVIFAVIGPVVGTFVISILFGLMNSWVYGIATLNGILQFPGAVIAGLVTGASYIAGGIPAATAGLMVGVKHVYFGGASWRFALGVGILVGIALEIFFEFFIATHNERLVVELLIVTTLSTLVCWRMVKSWFEVKL